MNEINKKRYNMKLICNNHLRIFIALKILFLFTLSLQGQTKKIMNVNANSSLFKILAGEYYRCEVTMGYATGVGRVTLGNPSESKYTSVSEFSFLISVLGRQDIQFGKMTSVEVETTNFNDFLFRIQWRNNRKDQGTLSAEIQVFYSFTKAKYETYFVNNSSSVFNIFWWTELNNTQKNQLNALLNSLYKKEFEKINAENERKRKISDSLNFILQKEQNTRDSISRVKKKEQESRQMILDSINLIKKRIQDSLNDIRLIEEKRIAEIEQKRLDSINYIQKNIEDTRIAKIIKNQKLRLNYWGLFFGTSKLNKSNEFISGDVWKYVSRDSLARDGKPIDGSGYGYGILFSRRIASYFGFEFMFSEFKDGSYKIDSETTLYSSSSSTKYSLLKNTFISLGPIVTIPIIKANLDFRYLYTFSRAVFKEPTQSSVIKYKSTSSGSIFGAGIRFAVGKGENLLNNKISLGQLGIYYDLYRGGNNFEFGALPFYEKVITIRYVNTIN